MNEHFRYAQAREKRDPTLWNNHSVADSCDSIDQSFGWQEERKFVKLAKDGLSEFSNNKNYHPLAEFKSGATFQGQNYPHGTLVLAQGVIESWDLALSDSLRLDFQYLGVICKDEPTKDKSKNAIVYYDYYPESKKKFKQKLITLPEIETQRVLHVRHTVRNILYAEDLHRIDSITVLKIGSGRTGKRIPKMHAQSKDPLTNFGQIFQS